MESSISTDLDSSWCHSKKNIHATSQALLTEFGLHIDENDKLVDENGEPFEWNYYENPDENCYRYARVAKAMDQHVFEELNAMLLRVWLCSFRKGAAIFVSDNFEEKEHLLVLINGDRGGDAGIWSRSVMIFNGIDCGSQFPYLRRALSNDWGVLVTNPNDCRAVDGSRSPTDHGLRVCNFLRNSRNKKIAIVAHGTGGSVAVEMLKQNLPDFAKRVFAIALIASTAVPHSLDCRSYFNKVTTNWVRSYKPLGTPNETKSWAEYRVSAGTIVVKEAPHLVIDKVFEYITDSFTEKQPGSAVELAKRRREREVDCQSRQKRYTRRY